jgi:hypothetical protein
MKRWLIGVRKVITPQRDLVASLVGGVAELPGMTREIERYYRDLYDHLIRISDLVDSYRDLLTGSMDAYLSTVSNRLNAIMKQLTLIATIFLPLSFLTGFFGRTSAGWSGASAAWARSCWSGSEPNSSSWGACWSSSAAAGGCRACGGSGPAMKLSRRGAARDGLLVLLTLTTGAVDASCFLHLGNVFSSVITGNLILLGVAAATQSSSLAIHGGTGAGRLLGGSAHRGADRDQAGPQR